MWSLIIIGANTNNTRVELAVGSGWVRSRILHHYRLKCAADDSTHYTHNHPHINLRTRTRLMSIHLRMRARIWVYVWYWNDEKPFSTLTPSCAIVHLSQPRIGAVSRTCISCACTHNILCDFQTLTHTLVCVHVSGQRCAELTHCDLRAIAAWWAHVLDHQPCWVVVVVVANGCLVAGNNIGNAIRVGGVAACAVCNVLCKFQSIKCVCVCVLPTTTTTSDGIIACALARSRSWPRSPRRLMSVAWWRL